MCDRFGDCSNDGTCQLVLKNRTTGMEVVEHHCKAHLVLRVWEVERDDTFEVLDARTLEATSGGTTESEVDGESLDVEPEPLEVDGESLEVDGESLDVERGSLEGAVEELERGATLSASSGPSLDPIEPDE